MEWLKNIINYGKEFSKIDVADRIAMVITAILIWLIAFSFLVLCDICNAQEIDINAIIQIESSGNPRAISYKGAEFGAGICQISKICHKEYQNYHKGEAVPENGLFDKNYNIKIADWYLNKRIPEMLRYYKCADTVENRLIAYNAGIAYVVKGKTLPKETRNYIRKYREITESRRARRKKSF